MFSVIQVIIVAVLLLILIALTIKAIDYERTKTD